MPALVPNRFLVKLVHPCPYVRELRADEAILLPESATIRNGAELDGRTNFAEVRLGWNEFGIGFQVSLAGKTEPAVCDASKPKTSDGFQLWIDTRDSRTSHRANRFCHHFYFLPSGGGPDASEPIGGQLKINRALQDAELAEASQLKLHVNMGSALGKKRASTLTLSGLIPAECLTGFDPEQFPRLGFYYHVRDTELGDQYLAVNTDFPFHEDPSLWEILELQAKS